MRSTRPPLGVPASPVESVFGATMADDMNPVFVIGASRQCVASVIDIAATTPDAWVADHEMPNLIESIPEYHPEAHAWRSSRLTAAEMMPDAARQLSERLLTRVRNRDDLRPTRAEQPITVIQDAVADALRIPFLAGVFPTAKFVYVHRSIPDALIEMEAVWNARRHSPYALPGWEGPPWALALIPGWQELVGCPVSKIVTTQWNTIVGQVIDDLSNLESGRWCAIDYDRLLADSGVLLSQALNSLGLDPDERTHAGLLSKRRSSAHGDRPSHDQEPDAASSPAKLGAGADHQQARPAAHRFGMRYSSGFPAVLNELGISLLVTKYDTNGALVCLSEYEGELQALTRPYDHPSGIGLSGSVLSVGSLQRVELLRDRLSELNDAHVRSRDACYIPYATYTTGDFGVRELAYAGGRLHLVSAMFSALCVVGEDQQITPYWSPPFITSIAAEDRCHLNGVAIVDDEVGYVSALGMTDTRRGWRDGKINSGVVLDVKTGGVAVSGLCVPHSPRWREGRLWLLESGTGSLLCADPVTGGKETVHSGRGFCRGLALSEKYAFVGISPARGSILRGLPIEGNRTDAAGVCVIDTRRGTVVASLFFDENVGEIFDVQILHHRFPDVAETDGLLVNQCFVRAPDGWATTS